MKLTKFNKRAAEILLTAIGIGVSVVYSGEHLENLGQIKAMGTGLPVGYIIAAMIAVMVFGLFKVTVNSNVAKSTRLSTFLVGLLIAAISINTAYQNMYSHDIESVKAYNKKANEEAEAKYQALEAKRIAQHKAQADTGKASVFKADTTSLDASIAELEEQTKEAQANYMKWQKKLMTGRKQSQETKQAAAKAEQMYNTLRDDLKQLQARKKQSVTGMVTTTSNYIPSPKPDVQHKSNDPFILTYAITIDAYLLFIAFLFRPRNTTKQDKANQEAMALMKQNNQQMVKQLANSVAQISDMENEVAQLYATQKSDKKAIKTERENYAILKQDMRFVECDLAEAKTNNYNTNEELEQKKAEIEKLHQQLAENNTTLAQIDAQKRKLEATLSKVIAPILNSVISGKEPTTKAGNYSKKLSMKKHKLRAEIVDIAFSRLVEIGKMQTTGNGNTKRWMPAPKETVAINDANVVPLRKAS